jgi:hypothetical protein
VEKKRWEDLIVRLRDSILLEGSKHNGKRSDPMIDIFYWQDRTVNNINADVYGLAELLGFSTIYFQCQQIIYTYIRMTHYKSFSAILLACKMFTSSIKYQINTTSCHIIFYSIFFKIINLTHMISISNFIFTVVFYTTTWTKLNTTCICFKKIIN